MPYSKSTRIDGIDSTKPLGGKPLGRKAFGKESFDRSISIKVRCNYSIHKGKLFFHNKLDRKENSVIVDVIKAVLELDGKTINSSDIPFEVPPGREGEVTLPLYKKGRKRMESILSEYNTVFREGALIKNSPKSSHNVKKDTLRLIVEKEEESWVVVLIDPWHLFATNNYELNYPKYIKKAVFDIKDLLK